MDVSTGLLGSSLNLKPVNLTLKFRNRNDALPRTVLRTELNRSYRAAVPRYKMHG